MLAAEEIINAFEPLCGDKEVDFNKLGETIEYMPSFPEQTYFSICQQVIKIFMQEKTLLELNGQFTIVGDLHGNIRDLLRILTFNGIPGKNPNLKYIFLGDYVDRGEFSIQVIILLFALKIRYPKNIFLLRGNHEFYEVNSLYGFKDQVLQYYSVALYDLFNTTFSFLPLAAVVNQKTFLVHGGISQYLANIYDIEAIPKKGNWDGTDIETQIVQDMMWSDPLVGLISYGRTMRGKGHTFGANALEEFITANQLVRVIRSHQCVMSGVEGFDNEKLITVFSTSNYRPDIPNNCGIIKINEKGDVEAFNMHPIEHLRLNNCQFKNFGEMPKFRSRVRLELRKYSSIINLVPQTEFKPGSFTPCLSSTQISLQRRSQKPIVFY